MDKIIYIVTSGNYSDYSIVGVFDSEENAKSFIESSSDTSNDERSYFDYMEIEEHDLNPGIKQIRKGLKYYGARMDREGNTESVEVRAPETRERSISYTYDKTLMNSYCYAKDKKHAIKITNERRIQILARNEWAYIEEESK